MKTIRNYLVIALMFAMVLCSDAQDRISIGVTHDVKLGLGLDSNHANTDYTLDLITTLNLEGKQYRDYYFSLNALYERANLSSGYFERYGVSGMWNFNQLNLDDLEISMGVGLFTINRSKQYGTISYSATIDVCYPIFNNLYVLLKIESLQRTDLITPQLIHNLSTGLKYKI